MDIGAFQSFLAVFDTGTATAAATRRYVSQPALSRQIHSLEKQCRTALFIRSKSGMQPTQAARRIEPMVRRLVNDLHSVEMTMSSLADERAPLTIACPTMVAEGLLLPFVAETQTQVTNVVEGPTTELFNLLGRREADLAMVPLTPPPEFESQLIYRIPFTLQVPNSSPLAERTAMDIRELGDLPIICPDRTNGTRVALDEHMTEANVRFRPILEVSRAHIGQAMVSAGKGYVITIDTAKYDLTSIPLTNGSTPLTLDEWAVWQGDHYAIDSITEFISNYLGWMRGLKGMNFLEFV